MRISDWSSDVCSSDLSRRTSAGLERKACSMTGPLNRARIGVVGAGRVGAVLASALRSVGHEIVAVAGEDRKSVGAGKRVSVRVDPGGRRTIKKKIRKP